MVVRLKPLNEQTIVITGASSGIGLATAEAAADAGAALVLVARNAEALNAIAADFVAGGVRAVAVPADIADEGAAQRIVDAAEREFGGFDTWINNAAVAMFARLDQTTMKEHRQIFDIGYFGLVNASLAAARHLRNKGGAIINVGSILSDRTVPIQGAYSAMKHAVQGFTEGLRMELEMEGVPISVTLIKPSGIHTPYPEHARSKLDRPAAIPSPVYDPKLVAQAVCHAATHSRRSITVGGQGLVMTRLANLFPRATDKIMERFYGESAQSTDQPPPRGVKDNLFGSRRDGRIESDQDQYVRRRSITLQAQLHPVATAAVAGGVALAAAGLLWGRKTARKARAFESGSIQSLARNDLTADPGLIEIVDDRRMAEPEKRAPSAADITI